MHTTTFEVYQRMWCVHEVDEGNVARINPSGLFDVYQWTLEKLAAGKSIETKNSECGQGESGKADRLRLSEIIESREGGFERLDETIGKFRSNMFEALEAQLKQKRETEDVKRKDEYHQFRQDWWYCEQRDESTRLSGRLKFLGPMRWNV